MIKFYDKLLLIVSLALLLASSGYYMTKGKPNIAQDLVDREPSGEEIATVEVKPYAPKALVWQEPVAQDAEGLWEYDIFTPPKIWWDPDTQELVAQSPYTGPVTPKYFGVYLVGIQRELYRIQFDAYFGGMGDPNTALIQFYDRERDETCRGRVGAVFEENDFKILACTNKREKLPGGIRATITRITILDTRTNREIELNSEGKHYIEGDFSIEFATTAKPYGAEQTFVLKQVGDRFQIDGDTFILKNFDFDNQSATLEKLSPHEGESDVRTLEVFELASSDDDFVREPKPANRREEDESSFGAFEF